jgi:large subunit ribosomal protein L4
MTMTDAVVRGPVKKERAAPVTRTVTRRSIEGKDLGQVDLEPTIFGIEPNLAVLHQVVTAQLAAARSGTQSTKTRAEVRGGGAKPFAQKGTGRARQGSSRSPSMIGGGVALGPKPRSYRQHTPKKMVRLALLSALSDRASLDRVALVDAWGWDEPKTKAAVSALQKLKTNGRILVVLADEEIVARRSFANLPEVHVAAFGELSAHDVLRCDWIVFSDRTLPGSTETFSTGLAPVAAAEEAEVVDEVEVVEVAETEAVVDDVASDEVAEPSDETTEETTDDA